MVALNGQPVKFNGREIPPTLRVGAIKLTASIPSMCFSELFDRMQNAINETSDASAAVYFNG